MRAGAEALNPKTVPVLRTVAKSEDAAGAVVRRHLQFSAQLACQRGHEAKTRSAVSWRRGREASAVILDAQERYLPVIHQAKFDGDAIAFAPSVFHGIGDQFVYDQRQRQSGLVRQGA